MQVDLTTASTLDVLSQHFRGLQALQTRCVLDGSPKERRLLFRRLLEAAPGLRWLGIDPIGSEPQGIPMTADELGTLFDHRPNLGYLDLGMSWWEHRIEVGQNLVPILARGTAIDVMQFVSEHGEQRTSQIDIIISRTC